MKIDNVEESSDEEEDNRIHQGTNPNPLDLQKQTKTKELTPEAQISSSSKAVLSHVSHLESEISHSDSVFACPFCDYKTENNKIFDRHVNSHHHCDQCEKSFYGHNAKR